MTERWQINKQILCSAALKKSLIQLQVAECVNSPAAAVLVTCTAMMLLPAEYEQ
jgi:hypothetical protein